MLFSPSLDAALALCVATPIILLSICSLLVPAHKTSRSRPLTHLLLAHTFYTLYTLLRCHPPNIFSDLQLPLSAPDSVIRATVARHATTDPRYSGPGMDELIAKLGSFETRIMLVRFGHSALNAPGTNPTLYLALLASLSAPLLSYTLRACVVGFLTIRGSGHTERRKLSVGALACAACAEVWLMCTATVTITRDEQDVPIMYHAWLWSLRQLTFLALPAVIHFLPPVHTIPIISSLPLIPGPSPPPATYSQLRAAVDSAQTRLSFLRFASGAVRRHPELNARADTYWRRERDIASQLWADDGVRESAKKAGLDIGEVGEKESGAFSKLVRDTVALLRTNGLRGLAE
ncbi:hypothetical protein OF83DRAFT_931475 [Amylostereum chailletii]|nr:hypothetical protein OF83DRAFT_931475 [Amylostereum chailletii]